jgi:hypothetical protein
VPGVGISQNIQSPSRDNIIEIKPDYIRLEYQDDYYTTRLLFDPVQQLDKTGLWQADNAGGTYANIYMQGAELIGCVVENGVDTWLRKEYNLVAKSIDEELYSGISGYTINQNSNVISGELKSTVTDATNTSQINISPIQIDLTQDNGSTVNSFTIVSTQSIFNNIVNYGSNLSANYTNRTLVDKEYVDNAVSIPAGATAGSFGITIDGGGSAITTGVKGYVEIPYSGTITGWTILGDVSGSCVIDIWKDTFVNFPPTVADTIAGSEKPTLSSAVSNRDLNLTTWTTSVTAGDIIAFNVDSASTVTRVNLTIKITKS